MCLLVRINFGALGETLDAEIDIFALGTLHRNEHCNVERARIAVMLFAT